jgi:hypothetical protein
LRHRIEKSLAAGRTGIFEMASGHCAMGKLYSHATKICFVFDDQAEGALNRYIELLEEAMGQGALTSGEWENPVLEDMRIGLEQCRSSN